MVLESLFWLATRGSFFPVSFYDSLKKVGNAYPTEINNPFQKQQVFRGDFDLKIPLTPFSKGGTSMITPCRPLGNNKILKNTRKKRGNWQ